MFNAAMVQMTEGRQNELRRQAATLLSLRVAVGARWWDGLRDLGCGSRHVAASAPEGPSWPHLVAGRTHRPGYELIGLVMAMRQPVRRMSAATIVAITSFLWFMSSPGGASTGSYDADKVPGVHASVDCVKGTGYVEVGNTDMASSTIEVTIDGVRRSNLHVDNTGYLHQWYSLAPGKPHRLSIVYDFVPGGTPDEENQVITVSCLDRQPLAGTGDLSGDCSAFPLVGSTFTPVLPTRVSGSGHSATGPLCPGLTRAYTATGVDGGPIDG